MTPMPVRFIILADLRTGSTLLSASLDRHPAIRCYGELFHERDFDDNRPDGCDRTALDAAALLDRAWGSGGRRAVGFRAMLDHPPASRPQWRDLWERLAACPDLGVIHLRRRDRLAQYASLMIAASTGVFHPSPQTPAIPPEHRPRVRIDPDRFRTWAAAQQAREQERLRILGHHRLLALSYERLTGDWVRVTRYIQHFLEVPLVRLPQVKHKQEHRALAEAIENYDELLRCGVVERAAGGAP